MLVEAKRHFSEVGAHLPPCGYLGLNSDYQVLHQAPNLEQPSCRPMDNAIFDKRREEIPNMGNIKLS